MNPRLPAALLTTAISVALQCSCAQRTTSENLSQITHSAKRDAVDVLFVLTVGNSTTTLKAEVGRAFPDLFESLTANAPSVSLHVGTTSTEMGAGPYQPASCVPRRGKLYVPPPEKLPATPRPRDDYLVATATSNNVIGSDPDQRARLYAAFQGMTDLGYGCSPFGNVHSLEAARVALLPETNPGFVRDDAFLLVVYVADTMDCSLENYTLFDPAADEAVFGPNTSFRCFEFGFSCDINGRTVPGPRKNCQPVSGWLHPITRYVDFYRKLKPSGHVLVAGIAGTPAPIEVVLDSIGRPMIKNTDSCFEGGAQPEVRLNLLLQAFPPALFASKCTPAGTIAPDYREFFSKLGGTVAERLSAFCLPKRLVMPKLDAVDACTVTMVDTAGEHELPSCPANCADCPCWSPRVADWCTDSGAAFTINGPQSTAATLKVACSW